MELARFPDQTWWWLLQKSWKYQEINMKVIIKTLKKMPKHTRGKPGAGMFMLDEQQNWWGYSDHGAGRLRVVAFCWLIFSSKTSRFWWVSNFWDMNGYDHHPCNSQVLLYRSNGWPSSDAVAFNDWRFESPSLATWHLYHHGWLESSLKNLSHPKLS